MGLWTFAAAAAAALAIYGWMLAATVGSLVGVVRPAAGSLSKRVVKSGLPPMFDEAHGSVMVLESSSS